MQVAWNLSKLLWALNIVAGALVVGALYSTGLQRTFRFFSVLIIVQLARSLVLFPLAPRSLSYYRIWSVTQPILWLFYVLVVFELYSLVWKQYRGIYSLGRWFFFTAVATSVIISALIVLPTISGPPGNRPQMLYYAGLIERGLVPAWPFFSSFCWL